MATATEVRSDTRSIASTGNVDMKLEAIVIPVSDVERAKKFYEKLGWRMDGDFATPIGRIVQFTPPGSGCSIQFGEHVTSAKPGSASGLYLITSDVEAARAELLERGIAASEVFHCSKGYGCAFRDAPGDGRASGLAPDRASYLSFVTFNDPDGNEWLFQEITTRLPGRIDSKATSFASVSDLASAMRRAEAAHGEHEKKLGHRDEDWPSWYAEYMAREQSGEPLPT